MVLDFANLKTLEKYKILNSYINPRPIALVSTISEDGVNNLAPFSFFGIISVEPAILSISFLPKSNGDMKDTLQNLKATKRATICLTTPPNLSIIIRSSEELEHHISEAVRYQIQTKIIESDYPPMPFLGEKSKILVSFFCDLFDVLDFSSASRTALLRVQKCHIEGQNIDPLSPLELPNFLGVKGNKFIKYEVLNNE